MRVVCASNNKNKIREMGEILSAEGFEVIGLSDIGFTDEIEETGTTFEENALIKARTVCRVSGLAAIADDSGIVVDALNGEPGVYSARYGGDACADDRERYMLLLKNMEGEKNRTARFVSCIACVFPDGREVTAHGYCEGEIIYAPRGDGGFGYDPIFLITALDKTMAEITAEEKNRISHRAAAISAFVEKLGKE